MKKQFFETSYSSVFSFKTKRKGGICWNCCAQYLNTWNIFCRRFQDKRFVKRDLWPTNQSCVVAIVMPWNVMLWHHAKIPSIILPLLRLSLFFCIIRVPFIKMNDWKTFLWMLVYLISKTVVFIINSILLLRNAEDKNFPFVLIAYLYCLQIIE